MGHPISLQALHSLETPGAVPPSQAKDLACSRATSVSARLRTSAAAARSASEAAAAARAAAAAARAAATASVMGDPRCWESCTSRSQDWAWRCGAACRLPARGTNGCRCEPGDCGLPKTAGSLHSEGRGHSRWLRRGPLVSNNNLGSRRASPTRGCPRLANPEVPTAANTASIKIRIMICALAILRCAAVAAAALQTGHMLSEHANLTV